ncbi:hypothetical protein V6Z12_A11G274200 [Gossypium hirsutum]
MASIRALYKSKNFVENFIFLLHKENFQNFSQKLSLTAPFAISGLTPAIGAVVNHWSPAQKTVTSGGRKSPKFQ